MRFRSLIAAALVATASFVLASPASATTEVTQDVRGDANSSYADITSVGVTYSETVIGLGLFTAKSWSPSTWGSGDAINWEIDVNGDSTTDYEVWWLEFGATVHAASDGSVGPILCTATTSYDAGDNYYFAGFPKTCIGSPSRVRVRGYIALGYTNAADFAPSHNTFTPFAYPEGVQAQPQPSQPQPSQPQPSQPDPTLTTAGDHSGGYWMLTQNGQVYSFGSAQHHGNEVATTVKRVDIDSTPSGNGYWILAESGAVHAKGDAQWLGSALSMLQTGEKAAALSPTPSGNGYWIFTDRGRVMNFGDAQHFGDMSGTKLNGAVLGSVATPSGQGYWMVGSDGGIFSFGDAKFSGSTGNLKLNKPVMAMAPDPDGSGYWLVASDGGIFAFDAPFYGSMGATKLNKPITGMVPGPGGYMMVGGDGGIFSFGNVAFHGSLGANPPAQPVVAVSLQP